MRLIDELSDKIGWVITLKEFKFERFIIREVEDAPNGVRLWVVRASHLKSFLEGETSMLAVNIRSRQDIKTIRRP